jgi:hypothetical protein
MNGQLLRTPQGVYINGRLFCEIGFHEKKGARCSNYVVGLRKKMPGVVGEPYILEAYYTNHASKHTKNISKIPCSLSGIRVTAILDAKVKEFLQQLDETLVDHLIAANLDNINIYALLQNYPELKLLLHRPVIVLAAYYRLDKFEEYFHSSKIPPAYEEWLPRLYGVQSFPKSLYRALEKIDLRNSESVVSGIPFLARVIKAAPVIISRSNAINMDVIRVIDRLVDIHPAITRTSWFSLDIVPSVHEAERVQVLLNHTEQLLNRLDVSNWEQALYRQTKSISDVLRLHDRYAERDSRIEFPNRKFPIFDLRETENCTIVKDSDELRMIAKSFHNCAAIFADEAAEGRLVHVLYKEKYDKALLQIDVADPEKAVVLEYSAPCNKPASSHAFSAARRWIREGIPSAGGISKERLLKSLDEKEEK